MNVGIIGLGVGERHLSYLKKNKDIKKIKIFDINRKKMLKMSKKYNVEIYRKEEEIYKDKSINLVCICSYDNCHFNQIKKCIKSKKHIFVEKPAVNNFNSAKKIFNLLKQNKKIYFNSNYILRKYPKFIFLKKLIKEKKLGKTYAFEGDYNYGRLNKLTKGWRGKIPFYSVTSGGGIHIFDLSNFILENKIVEVKSFSNKIVTSGTNFKYPDCVITVAKYQNGMIGKFTSNFGCVYPHFHKISLYGSKKTFENTVDGVRVYNRRDKKDYSSFNFNKKVDKSLILKDFIYSIKKKINREKFINEVFNSLSVCFAVEKSYKNISSVKVNYLK